MEDGASPTAHMTPPTPSPAHNPVDALEKSVRFDILNPMRPRPQAICRVSLKQHPQQSLGLRREKLGHTQLGPGGERPQLSSHELGTRTSARKFDKSSLQNHGHSGFPVLPLEG